MAVVLLDNLPLPSLRSYTIGSLLLFVVATFYGYNYNYNWKVTDGESDQNSFEIIASLITNDPFSTWVGWLRTA